jgi:hypothetical protein
MGKTLERVSIQVIDDVLKPAAENLLALEFGLPLCFESIVLCARHRSACDKEYE